MKIARCDYCKKSIPTGAKAIPSPDGLLFDSTKCRQRYLTDAPLKALSNAVRVARSRLKARSISRAESVYRKREGRDWATVKKLLVAIL